MSIRKTVPAASTPAGHLPAADGIRGMACLIVLVMHAFSILYPASFPYLRGGGKYGVWLFFVLSAFLLSLRLQQRSPGVASMIDYALGRCLRILPPFALACLLYYWAGIGIESGAQLIDALTFRQGFIHLWTVPVEFKFYLLLPLLCGAAIALQRRHGDSALLLALLCTLGLQQWLWPYWQTPWDSPATRWYLAPFLFGTASALLLPRWRALPRQRMATLFALATLTALMVALPGTRLWLFGTPLSGDLMNKHVYLGLLWAIFVGLLVDGQGLAGRLLCSRLLRFLGRISYSAYLFHWLIMVKLGKHLTNQPLAIPAALLLTIAAGTAGYYLIEHPLERLRKSLTRLTAAQKTTRRLGMDG